MIPLKLDTNRYLTNEVAIEEWPDSLMLNLGVVRMGEGQEPRKRGIKRVEEALSKNVS